MKKKLILVDDTTISRNYSGDRDTHFNYICLLEQLECLPADYSDYDVMFDFAYFHPSQITSWRGYYAWPALTYERDPRSKHTLEAFIRYLKLIRLEPLVGYKGGSSPLEIADTIHVALPDEAGNTVIAGCVVDEDLRRVILKTDYEV